MTLVRGEIVSVNVGGTQTVEWAGRQVRTAIWKQPVDGRVPVRGVNLEGDDQADRRVHGGPDKAVYAYAAEDYEWWSGEFGRPIGPGTFGENLTVRDLDLASAVLGEVWEAGTATLHVSQPRLPCFKLGIRMGDAAFVDRFGEARRLGTYLRIARPGDVAAGDEVRVVHRPAHGLTVTDLAAAMVDPPAELLERIVTIADVPESWREWAVRQRSRRQPA